MNLVLAEKRPEIIEKGKVVAVKRPDGLTVFYDGDEELDNIRENASKKAVIAAVAIRRAQQIARNYAIKYAPELVDSFEPANIAGILQSSSYRITKEI